MQYCVSYSFRLLYRDLMPRQSRIDAPGALHHIICRGIERRRIFKDDQDRDRFIEQLDGGLIRSGGVALRKIRVLIWKLPKPHKHMGVPLSLLEIVLNALDWGAGGRPCNIAFLILFGCYIETSCRDKIHGDAHKIIIFVALIRSNL